MGIEFLFKKDKWIGSEADKIEADVFLTSNATRTRKVPMHPVQGGTQFADTIIKDPVSLTIQGFISDTPINGMFGNSPVGAIAPTIPLNLIGRKKKVALLYNKLIGIYEKTDSLSLVTIKDGRETYRNMALTSLSFPKMPSDGEGFRFSASFVQVIVTKVQSVVVEDIGSGVSGDGASSAMASGSAMGITATETAKNKSALKSLVGGLFGEENFSKFVDFFGGGK